MSWQRQVCAYDDDALTQLASSGLLRRARKQLESGKVELLADEAGEGRFRVGDQQVTLLDAPLERAACDCSASGLCVHILAAALQTREQSPPAETDPTAVEAAQELSALTPEQIMRWAGKPATRLAARLLDALDDGEGRISERPASLEIALDQETACRYILGAGLEGVICDAPESRRKGIIAACLLHWMQRQGRALRWPEESRPAQAEAGLSKGERELLAQVRQQLEGMLACGLMHLPQANEQSLRNLAWSARGGNLPRLSALLLRLCGEMAAFRKRQASTDTGSLLELLVSTRALCDGLSANDPAAMGRLRGAFRRDYTAAEVGPLWSCGAYRYESRSGARGLGLLLWDLHNLRPLRINLGRSAEAGRLFNPRESWQQVLPWSNAQSPLNLSGKVLQLEGARTSSDGRLSLSQETRLVTTHGAGAFAEAIERLGHARWSDLGEQLAEQIGETGLAPPYLLRPKRIKPFRVSELDQRWNGWAQDREGVWLRLSAPVEEGYNDRIGAFNTLINHSPSRFWGLIVEPRWDRERLSWIPLAAVHRQGDDWECLNPDLQPVSGKNRKSLGDWLRQAIGSGKGVSEDQAEPSELAALGRLLTEILQQLLAIAELGLDIKPASNERLPSLIRSLQSANAPRLAGSLRRFEQAAGPETLVRAYHAFNLAWRQYQIQAQTRSGLGQAE